MILKLSSYDTSFAYSKRWKSSFWYFVSKMLVIFEQSKVMLFLLFLGKRKDSEY